jgi:epoxide hydrolase-like predicted phosphatase
LSVRAVVFDLGKVLVDFDYGIAARKLAQRSGASAADIQRIIDQSPLLFRYESAQMTTPEFFAEAKEQIRFTGTFDEFAAAFADIFTEIPEMTRLQAHLRDGGLHTSVLSNTNEIAIAHVRKNFPFFAGFADYVFSFEHAALKPDERIYRIAEQRSGVRGGEVLFIDDKPENVSGARQLGWQTICHQSADETIRRVREIMEVA